jgi:hypothetical protein
MLTLGWQDLIALAVVFAAAAYLARLAWRGVVTKRDRACGSGCARCAANSDASPSVPEQVVSIGPVGSPIRR